MSLYVRQRLPGQPRTPHPATGFRPFANVQILKKNKHIPLHKIQSQVAVKKYLLKSTLGISKANMQFLKIKLQSSSFNAAVNWSGWHGFAVI